MVVDWRSRKNMRLDLAECFAALHARFAVLDARMAALDDHFVQLIKRADDIIAGLNSVSGENS